ncbi:MAG: ferrous iron transport protein B [Myxococcota bacterium]
MTTAPAPAAERAQSPEPTRRRRPDRPVVLVAGNPNAGKTTLFNALSGARSRVGNYPGTTVDRRTAKLALPAGETVELVDIPGTYSLSARSPEEQVAVDAVLGRKGPWPDAVVVVADATALARNLYLSLQIAETGVPLVVALNMMDEARAAGLEIDAAEIGRRLGAEVVPVVASRGHGRQALLQAVERAVHRSAPTGEAPDVPYDPPVLEAALRTEPEVARWLGELPAGPRRAWALWCLLSLGDDELEDVPQAVRRRVEEARREAAAEGVDLDVAIIASRYRWVDEAVAAAVKRPEEPRRTVTDRLDAVLTHPVLGFAAFVAVMLLVFEALFSWSEPAIGFIEDQVAALQGLVSGVMAAGPLRDLLVDGVIAGVGNVIVFVPQIALLFLFIGFLEDSGYLARVAFVIDRIMSSVGLHGRAFVPLLSGFACAVPAVMATRTIESRRDRLVTMLALPLMSCSARLPVYVLVIATVFAGAARVGGVLSAGAVALLGMYLLSVAATLGAAAVLRRTVLRGPRPTLVLELPPYRLPLVSNLVRTTWQRVRTFLVDAGTIILALTIVMWALLSFPKSPEVAARYDARRAEIVQTVPASERDDALVRLEGERQAAQLERSVAGRVGRFIEPALEPLGFDWRIGVGILGAFAAREVFVSTLGMVFGIGEADEASEPLRTELRQATRADGSPLMTPLVGVSLMVFFVLACQCMSTIAVVRRESGSWKWPLLMFAYMTVLAYLGSLLVFQVGTALGLGGGA